MNRSVTLFLCLFTILVCSCNTTPPRTITEMEFNVDSSIVNKPVTDSSLGIRYSVPAGWQAIEAPDEALQRAKSGNVRISNMLQDPSGHVVFSLTDVRQVPDSVFRNMDENFKTVLNPSGSWNDIQRDEFITAGYQVKQYVMAKQGQTFFKMLFGDRTRPSFQVDYSVIIDSAYTLNTKTLESIVGSLHRDH
ncbi:MAG TPA: hypothetical protein VFP97_11750 [Chitinophagaceae bacterium]|nr:hypothetical protein [Chitinophagaceae bacterium]